MDKKLGVKQSPIYVEDYFEKVRGRRVFTCEAGMLKGVHGAVQYCRRIGRAVSASRDISPPRRRCAMRDDIRRRCGCRLLHIT